MDRLINFRARRAGADGGADGGADVYSADAEVAVQTARLTKSLPTLTNAELNTPGWGDPTVPTLYGIGAGPHRRRGVGPRRGKPHLAGPVADAGG